MWNGKRISRFRVPKQLRADERLVREIQEWADRDNRDFSRQLFHFVSLGIIHSKKCERKSHSVTRRHRGAA
jgi:hypothetical protein